VRRGAWPWCLAVAAAVGCTDADLLSVPAADVVHDDKFQVSGQFCTGVPNALDFPSRIMFIVDISGSFTIEDPPLATCPAGPGMCLCRRAYAIEETLQRYPPGNGVEYAIIFFNGSATIPTKTQGFTSDPTEFPQVLVQMNVSNGQTNYDGALQLAYQTVVTDMTTLDVASRSRARYELVFMSDGFPDPDNTGPGESLPLDIKQDVVNIAALQTTQGIGTVALNTVQIDAPSVPPSALFQSSTVMLDMATLGNGTYSAFNPNQPITLFNIGFVSVVQSYALKSFVVSNVNERPVAAPGGGTIPGVDSDGDGLNDDVEALIGTSPLLSDTDGDGFSDYLEWKLRNSGFDPLYPDDADCASINDRQDSDGDTLLDCEERYIATSLQLVDSDADGYADDLEYRNGTNPVIVDNQGDYDFDNAPNGFELGNHTDPQRNDVADFSQIAYRYDLQQIESSADAGMMDGGTLGQTCYSFTVDNITLAPTQSTVAGSEPGGTNSILLHVISAPSDNPKDPGFHQIACVRPRYQQSPDTKTPKSGAMTVPADAFKVPGLSPDGGVGFDENRDCILP
jgi:hypothetical protein